LTLPHAAADTCSNLGSAASEGCGSTSELVGGLGGTSASVIDLADLAPILPDLTASSVADFLGTLEGAKASFEWKLDWSPRIPTVAKLEEPGPESASVPPDLSTDGEGPTLSWGRKPLKRVSLEKPPPPEPPPEPRRRALQRVSVGRFQPLISRFEQRRPEAQESEAVEPASPPMRSSPSGLASKHRRHIAAAAEVAGEDLAAASGSRAGSSAGARTEASSSRGFEAAPAVCDGTSVDGSKRPGSGGSAVLPRIDSKGNLAREDAAGSPLGETRQNDAAYRVQAKRGLLMAALHVRPRDSTLPRLRSESSGRSKSSASLHGSGSRRSDHARMQRSLSLATSPCDRPRGPFPCDDSPGGRAAGSRSNGRTP